MSPASAWAAAAGVRAAPVPRRRRRPRRRPAAAVDAAVDGTPAGERSHDRRPRRRVRGRPPGRPRRYASAFLTLARRQRVGRADRRRARHGRRSTSGAGCTSTSPASSSRRSTSSWLIDVAAWQRLNRLHLHLTDDEAWRVPIAAYPALTEVGAWRGHGLPIPPLLGSGPEPVRRRLHRRRRSAGGCGERPSSGSSSSRRSTCPATASPPWPPSPSSAIPADTSGAVSVQHFVDNVLVPGLPATVPFLEAVFGELADLFPGALAAPRRRRGAGGRVGGLAGGPALRRRARARPGPTPIAAAFVADVIDWSSATTGRQVGVWQEAAECGALQPDDGYVVGWKSSADCRRLAAAGYQVVAAPAEVYYLDMAGDDDVAVAGHQLGREHLRRRHRGYDVDRPAGPPPSGPISSASRPACGPSTSTTAPPSPPAPPPPRRHRRLRLDVRIPVLTTRQAGSADPTLHRTCCGGRGRVEPCSPPHRSGGPGTTRPGSSSAPPGSAEPVRTRPTAILAQVEAAGINHIDTAAAYGESEDPPAALARQPPPRGLPRHQDRRPGRRRRPRLARALTRADGRRSRRPDPAAQPRRDRTSGRSPTGPVGRSRPSPRP